MEFITKTTRRNDCNGDKLNVFLRRGLTSILNLIILVWGLYGIILTPLKQDAMHMANYDPSEIISIPLKPAQLGTFLLATLCPTLLISTFSAGLDTEKPKTTSPHNAINDASDSALTIFHRSFLHGIISLGCITPIIFLLAILSGASPFTNQSQTLLASLYLSSVAFVPIMVREEFWNHPLDTFLYVVLGHQHKEVGEHVDSNGLTTYNIVSVSNVSLCSERIDHSTLNCTFGGVVLCMILVTYDWGAQCQRWPVPILIGSTLGYGLGVFNGLLLEWRNLRLQRRREKKS